MADHYKSQETKAHRKAQLFRMFDVNGADFPNGLIRQRIRITPETIAKYRKEYIEKKKIAEGVDKL